MGAGGSLVAGFYEPCTQKVFTPFEGSAWVKIKPPGIGPQVLVLGSIYQSNPFWGKWPWGFVGAFCQGMFGLDNFLPTNEFSELNH